MLVVGGWSSQPGISLNGRTEFGKGIDTKEKRKKEKKGVSAGGASKEKERDEDGIFEKKVGFSSSSSLALAAGGTAEKTRIIREHYNSTVSPTLM